MSRICVFALAMLATLSAAPAAFANVVIEIDKAAQKMTVLVEGETRWTWPVSTGRAAYDTPNGSYRAFRMEEDHYSKEWDEAPMPHSIFFTTKGHAIHGSFEVKRLGSPASHGCVRLHPEHAAKLFALVKKVGLPNTNVVVSGVLPAASAPAVARRTPITPGEQGSMFERRQARAAAPAQQFYYYPDRGYYAQPYRGYGYADRGYYGYDNRGFGGYYDDRRGWPWR